MVYNMKNEKFKGIFDKNNISSNVTTYYQTMSYVYFSNRGNI